MKTGSVISGQGGAPHQETTGETRHLDATGKLAVSMFDRVSSIARQPARYVLLFAGLLSLLAAIASKWKMALFAMTSDEFDTLVGVSVIFLFGGAVVEVFEPRSHVREAASVTDAGQREGN